MMYGNATACWRISSLAGESKDLIVAFLQLSKDEVTLIGVVSTNTRDRMFLGFVVPADVLSEMCY